VPFHAADELDYDEISIFDAENIILTGDIIERHRDAQTRERKYVIKGETLDGEAACCVVRSVLPRRSSSSRFGSRKAVMRRDMCGAATPRIRHVTRSFGRGGRLVVIENIPYVFCPRCGERYFTAATMREIERLKMLKVARVRRRAVPIVSFGAA
jgi:YgiT-type zinc finger domain-containing protein